MIPRVLVYPPERNLREELRQKKLLEERRRKERWLQQQLQEEQYEQDSISRGRR